MVIVASLIIFRTPITPCAYLLNTLQFAAYRHILLLLAILHIVFPNNYKTKITILTDCLHPGANYRIVAWMNTQIITVAHAAGLNRPSPPNQRCPISQGNDPTYFISDTGPDLGLTVLVKVDVDDYFYSLYNSVGLFVSYSSLKYMIVLYPYRICPPSPI